MDIVVLLAVSLAFVIMSIMIYPIVREKFVDLIAKNVREPKGVAGRIVRVSRLVSVSVSSFKICKIHQLQWQINAVLDDNDNRYLENR